MWPSRSVAIRLRTDTTSPSSTRGFDQASVHAPYQAMDRSSGSKRKKGSNLPSIQATGSNSPTQETSDVASVRSGYLPPGRLGYSRMELFQDPRLHPKLRPVLAQCGLDRHQVPHSLTALSPSSTLNELQASMAVAETEFASILETIPTTLTLDHLELEVTSRNELITGPNVDLITLCIYRPALRGGPLPCVVYAYGSGTMSSMRPPTKMHRRWCISLAAMGLIVVMVDYSNVPDLRETNPSAHPMALNHVCAAVHYVHSHRDDLSTLNIVLHGEAGIGGNLVLAAALKAKREGWLNKIDAVFAHSPYISNAYNWSEARKLHELPSLIECQGYVLNVDHMAYMAHLYTSSAADATNPLAWPYHASADDLNGLPPHVLLLDELDPLRSEGEGYARKLAAAGVQVAAQVHLGVVHATSLLFRHAVPEVHRSAVRAVAAFAKQA